jgi:P-type Ca2+ transporter type 2C
LKEFQENTRDLLERLNTDGSVGLSTGQVDAQRERYGSNTLTKEKPESLLKRIAEAASEPMILMLIMAGVILCRHLPFRIDYGHYGRQKCQSL